MSPTVFSKYVDFVKSLYEEEYYSNIQDVCYSETFKRFRHENLVTFAEARQIDEHLTGHSGSYWMAAVNYPKKGEILPIGTVKKVGILTFSV